MKSYKRHAFKPECNNPKPILLYPNSDFRESFKHYLTNSLSHAWWEYMIIGIVIVVGCVVNWIITVSVVGVLFLSLLGVALYTAKIYRDLYLEEAAITINEEGVHYAVVLPEDNEGLTLDDIPEGEEISVRNVSTSTWQELNEVRVFDDFVVLRFVPTSKLRIVFIPMDEEHKDQYVENILAYWHDNADNIPEGIDKRWLYVLIIIAFVALKYLIRKYA